MRSAAEIHWRDLNRNESKGFSASERGLAVHLSNLFQVPKFRDQKGDATLGGKKIKVSTRFYPVLGSTDLALQFVLFQDGVSSSLHTF